ncbi:hypothetical protein ACHQM5_000625 [Ranunculus cassubicifolius]
MEEIREMAFSYYGSCTDESKELVHKFFKSMDIDGNGSIGLIEFKTYLTKNSLVFRPELFGELDRDGNGCLDFNEVVTFYYMVNVRNLFCACCGGYHKLGYYTCVKCFLDQSNDRTYNICVPCYRTKQYNNSEHEYFLDNYDMLTSMRSEGKTKMGDHKSAEEPQLR